MAKPVNMTMATQSMDDRISEIDRATSTAGGHMGNVRKRSITPVLRSLLKPTAVPIAEVVKIEEDHASNGKLPIITAACGGHGRAEDAHKEKSKQDGFYRYIG